LCALVDRVTWTGTLTFKNSVGLLSIQNYPGPGGSQIEGEEQSFGNHHAG